MATRACTEENGAEACPKRSWTPARATTEIKELLLALPLTIGSRATRQPLQPQSV